MLGRLQKIPVISTFKIYKTPLCLFPHIYGLDELPKKKYNHACIKIYKK